MSTTNWDDLCPEGRVVFYEGDDPEGFAQQMLSLGIDVNGPGWGEKIEGGVFNIPGRDLSTGADIGPFAVEAHTAYSFFIPAGRVEEIYGSRRWPLGS